MTYIRNARKFNETFWDWSILDGCWGKTKIHPTDVDGQVDRNDQLLQFETKSPGVDLNDPKLRGQRWHIETLQRKGITVFVIWGQVNTPEHMQIFAINGTTQILDCDLDRLKYMVEMWFIAADSGGVFRLSDSDIKFPVAPFRKQKPDPMTVCRMDTWGFLRDLFRPKPSSS